MQLADLMRIMEEIAPLRLAENWDNCGLLLGDPAAEIRSVMTCLTLSQDVAEEALANRVDAIISHHPILFRPTKFIRADKPETSVAWRLARAGVAVVSHHTAWDGAISGANHMIAEVAGAVNIRPIQPAPARPCVKFVVFVPDENLEAVRQAAFHAGAGQIGLYDQCSYSHDGVGTFRGQKGASPAIGEVGNIEKVAEKRLEIISFKSLQEKVLAAIRQAHLYEEPAIDVYDLAGVASQASDGVGRVGDFSQAISIQEVAAKIGAGFHSAAMQISLADGAGLGQTVTKMAAACGAGDDLVDLALKAGAEVLITGELRFHTILKARDAGLSVILTGHYASERVSIEFLAGLLQKKCPELIVRASLAERDPLQNFQAWR